MISAGDPSPGYCPSCGRFYGMNLACPVCCDKLEWEQARDYRMKIITYSRRVSWLLVGILVGLLIFTDL